MIACFKNLFLNDIEALDEVFFALGHPNYVAPDRIEHQTLLSLTQRHVGIANSLQKLKSLVNHSKLTDYSGFKPVEFWSSYFLLQKVSLEALSKDPR